MSNSNPYAYENYGHKCCDNCKYNFRTYHYSIEFNEVDDVIGCDHPSQLKDNEEDRLRYPDFCCEHWKHEYDNEE